MPKVDYRKRTIEVVVIVDGSEPFDYVARGRNIGAAIRKEIERRGKVWYEAVYYFNRSDGTEGSGTLYNYPNDSDKGE